MTKIYDLSNPAAPVFIRDYGIVGQQPGSTGPVPTELHGPISLGPKANRVYFAHGTGRAGIIQIVDRDKLLNGPKEPTEANLLYPQISRVDLPPDAGAHTALPLLGMTLAEFAKQKPPANAPAAGSARPRRPDSAAGVAGASRLPGGCQRDDQRGMPRAAADRPDDGHHLREDAGQRVHLDGARERAATSASAAAASARMRRRRTTRRSTTAASCS